MGIAAQQQSAANVASIHGTVIDVKTGQPLAAATVVLHGSANSGESNSANTLPDGRFAFNGLAAGHYRLSVSRNGYTDPNRRGERGGGFGAAVSLAAGQVVDDLVLRLTPTGVIAGRIVNERG